MCSHTQHSTATHVLLVNHPLLPFRLPSSSHRFYPALLSSPLPTCPLPLPLHPLLPSSRLRLSQLLPLSLPLPSSSFPLSPSPLSIPPPSSPSPTSTREGGEGAQRGVGAPLSTGTAAGPMHSWGGRAGMHASEETEVPIPLHPCHCPPFPHPPSYFPTSFNPFPPTQPTRQPIPPVPTHTLFSPSLPPPQLSLARRTSTPHSFARCPCCIALRGTFYHLQLPPSPLLRPPPSSSPSPVPTQYSRAPNMDPSFIRPMPVLHTTMAHMLSLLHLPFPPPPSAAKGGAEEGEMEGEGGGEEAGGAGGPGMRLLLLHSFLWDRMRAVRADLRMQHLFGREAINMHEQMVRFHIVAMHELCEYPKGEGFSDGFDAHLNIEQMNKACVDLFHMYHDRRADLEHAQAMASEGEGGEEGEVGELEACLAQEGELRGYYLLLKIDRHPGFNVEPAEFARELSLLPHIVRSSPQVVFARSVARACRTHNFVAFFRLARQATYLQACLMHAHFSKMRSRALAAVYASIAKGQQLPALTLAHWLGMEQEPEKLQALVEHHGLALHPSDAPADATYPDTASPASALLAGSCLVKGAPLVQAGTPMPPSSSALVHSKQSRFIDDVISEVSGGGGGGGGGEEKGGEQVERQQRAEEQRKRQEAWLQKQQQQRLQQQQQQQQKLMMEQRQREEQIKAMEEKQRVLEREMERERERVRELERRAALQAQVKRQEEERKAREEEERQQREAEAVERERREKEREEQVRQERRRKEMEMRERILKERARVEREKREAEQREREREESKKREKERKERERMQREEEERQRRAREEEERARAALEEAGRKARGVWLRCVVRRWRQNAAQMGQLRRLRQLAVSDWQLEGSIALQPTMVASKQAPQKRLRGALTWGPPALGKASADRGGAAADSVPALAPPSAGGPRFLHPSTPWGPTGFAAPIAFAAPSPIDVARLVGCRLAGRQVPSSSAGLLLSARRVVSWKLLVCWPEREVQ
ncbi:unnamed protein product, partial [Closterium sp. NIES-54]